MRYVANPSASCPFSHCFFYPMKMPRHSSLLAALVASLAAGGLARAADAIPPRPDPREIPVPPIKTSLPAYPGPDQLPIRKDLPDPMVMNDGTKVTTPEQWQKRRAEIRDMLEYYHVGRMPPAPGNTKGVEVSSQLLAGGKVKYRLIKLTFGPNESLSLHVGIYTPAEGGPVPVVIQPGGPPPGAPALPSLGQGVGQGAGMDILLPEDVLKAQVAERAAEAPAGGRGARGGAGGARGARGGAGRGTAAEATAAATSGEAPAAAPGGPGGARGGRGGGFGRGGSPEVVATTNAAILHGFGFVTFSTNECAEDTTLRMPDGSFAFRTTRFFPAYPGYDWGIIGGWVWGTMRVVDWLVTDPAVAKDKIIITGTSRIGKAAMISGAFDDRIGMVAPGASSGLGTPSYRYSGEGRGGKEGLTMMVRKYGNQFSPHLHDFWGQEDKLPYDANFWPALTAPRPWIALEGTHDQNVVHRGVKETWLHARPVYEFLGVPNKIGVYWSDRPHGFSDTDWDGLLSFADQQLLGKRVSRAFDLFPMTDEVNPPKGDAPTSN